MDRNDFEIGLNLRLGASPKAARSARTAFRQALGEMLEGSELECVQLLISELVTNSYRHSRMGSEDRIDVSIRVSPERIRVEVTDPGRGFERLPLPSDDLRTSGWGLYLVDQMADISGVESDPTTTVWFEMFRTTEQSRDRRREPAASQRRSIRAPGRAPTDHG